VVGGKYSKSGSSEERMKSGYKNHKTFSSEGSVKYPDLPTQKSKQTPMTCAGKRPQVILSCYRDLAKKPCYLLLKYTFPLAVTDLRARPQLEGLHIK